MLFASILLASLRVAGAIAFVALATAARASAADCPRPLYLESSNGRYYVAVFRSAAPIRSSIGLTLFTKTNAYSASLSGISIEKPWTRGPNDTGFRSFTVLLANPGNDPLLGAIVRPYDLPDGTICPSLEWIVPTIDQVRRSGAEDDAATTSLVTEIAGEAGDGSNAFALNPIAMPTSLDCPVPFAHASITQLVTPDATPAPGVSPLTSYVRVDLSATGSVTQAVTAKSSNDPAFDRAALVAARKSTYAPRIFACEKEASTYVFAGKAK